MGRVVVSSLGKGDLDFDRKAAVPLARRSHDGLALVGGFWGTSGVDLADSKDEEEGDRAGLVISA